MTDAPPPAGIGHNVHPALDAHLTRSHAAQAQEQESLATDRLRSIVGRIERLNQERATLGSDIKDIFTEAKSAGYDPKVLRALIRDRKADPDELWRVQGLLDVYRRALGL